MKVSRTNDHKAVFKNLLSKYHPSVFYMLCNSGIFPRIEFEFKQLNVENEPYKKFILTINCYDKNNGDVIDDIVDSIIDDIGEAEIYTDKFYYKFIYGNDRQPISENDKTISRIMLTFEVRIYKRSE